MLLQRELQVNRIAYQHSYSFSSRPSPAWALLVQLSSAHDQLIAEMGNLDAITRREAAEPADITSGRWRISQASLKRRSLACRVFDFLADRLEGPDLAMLKEVRAADQAMMRRSAAHVGKWTMENICSDWPAYCDASRNIRVHMSAHIQLERQSLYPVLEALADRGF